MMKLIRLMLPILLLAVMLVGQALPLADGVWLGNDGASSWAVAEEGDKPWNPGDESADGKVRVYLAKRGDGPWDPGDESGRSRGVRRV